VDVEWAPDYATRPLVREHKEMDFVNRMLAKSATDMVQGRHRKWSTDIVKRMTSAAEILEGLTEAGEDPVFAVAAATLYALASQAESSRNRDVPEKPVALAEGKAALAAAGVLLLAYVTDLEAAIQRGETGFDETEPVAKAPPARTPAKAVPANPTINAWTAGESETDRLYRALENYM
jgi:hypothetical protein